MSDAFYNDMKNLASGILNQFKQGTVQLKRIQRVAGDKPWSKPTDTPVTYDLDAVVSGVDAAKIDGTRILATDLVVTTSPRMRLNGVYVEIEPTDRDQVVVRGKQRSIKVVDRIPGSGPAITFKLYVEG